MTTADKRRKTILNLINNSTSPISGEALGQQTGVSRQAIVQDIAILRAEGHEITSTSRGYTIDRPKQARRLFKVRHGIDQIEEELTIIVDLGGYVEDIIIHHKVYDKISGSLDIKSRRDVKNFLDSLSKGKSTALSAVTSGYHYHNVCAENEEILDEIEAALKEKKYIVDFLDHEKNTFDS